MTNILLVTSSIHGETALSHRLARDVAALWTARIADAEVTERHLTPDTIPHLTAEVYAAAGAPPEQRTAEQNKLAALADTIIAEAEAADVIVIAAPMYNFSIPSTLKAWIDHLTRAGRTFKYSPEGPVGQLKGKKVVVIESRGGAYANGSPWSAMDQQEPYLRTVLGFVGLDNISFIHAENQARGPEAAKEGQAAARVQLDVLRESTPALKRAA